MKTSFRILSLLFLLLFSVSCSLRKATSAEVSDVSSCFKIRCAADSVCTIVTVSPDGSCTDSLTFTGTKNRIVCMSSTYVASLSALGCDSTVCAVSGVRYISAPEIRRRFADGLVADLGVDANADFERLVSMNPDLVVMYSIPGSGDALKSRLDEFGIPVLVLYDYLENSPLARASYIKVFGAVTGRMEQADSIFDGVCSRYHELADAVAESCHETAKVLMNVPYADAWYVPGGENYMSRLVRDAGGEILGSVPGMSESSIISVEKALELSRRAQFWLHTGNYESKEALSESNELSLIEIPQIYNNTLRVNDGGGNDYWESGVVHPDWILHDLVKIFHPSVLRDTLGFYYYREVR